MEVFRLTTAKKVIVSLPRAKVEVAVISIGIDARHLTELVGSTIMSQSNSI